LDEKRRIDAELREMDKYPVDFSDIPPMRDEDRPRVRFGNERFLRSLPPDIVREMARRRHEELKAAGYDVPGWAPESASATVTETPV
jgi:hypothetical protein